MPSAIEHDLTSTSAGESLHERPLQDSEPNSEPLNSLATRLSKRVFQWLYSFSLFIFMVLTFAAIVVTPADIVVQTWGTAFTGIKTLIVIAACAIFFVMSMLLYISRLYKSRVAVNQIPSKSVYVPLEKNDLQREVLENVIGRLKECVGEIKVQADCLLNKNEKFNYPGMAPPEYIQKRNIKLGYQEQSLNLPPNCNYEGVIQSLGLMIKVDGLLSGSFVVPPNYTFREILVSMAEHLQDERQLDSDVLASFRTTIRLYEKMKFSGQLIQQHDLLLFLVEFEKAVLYFVRHQTGDVHLHPKQSSRLLFESELGDSPSDILTRRRSSSFLHPGSYSRRSPYSRDSDSESAVEGYFPQNWDGISRSSTRGSRSSFRGRTQRQNSASSTGSVIKSGLSFASLRGYSQRDMRRMSTQNSGYLTDSDTESEISRPQRPH